jgi:hypothetical protein
MVVWGGRLFGVSVERGLGGGQFRERPQDRPHGFGQFGMGAHVTKHSMIARHVLGLRRTREDRGLRNRPTVRAGRLNWLTFGGGRCCGGVGIFLMPLFTFFF